MKRISIALVTLVSFFFVQNLFAQHFIQFDDGNGHYTILRGQTLNPLDYFDFPPGGGTLAVIPPVGVPSFLWLTHGNSAQDTDNVNNLLGTLDNSPLRIVTGGINTRIFIDPTGTTKINDSLYALTSIGDGSANTQLTINGNANASSGDPYIPGNTSEWDLNLQGDMAVTGISRFGNSGGGGSIWIDGGNNPNTINADNPFTLSTNNGDLTLNTNSSGGNINLNPLGIVNVNPGLNSPVNNVGAMDIEPPLNQAGYPQNGDVLINRTNDGGLGGSLIVSNGSAVTGSSAAIGFNTDGTTAFDGSGNIQSNAEIRAINVNGSGGNNATDLSFSLWNGSTWPEIMRITSGGTVIPGTDVAYSLGSIAKRWQEIYVGPSSVHLYQLAAEGDGSNIRDWSQGIDITGNYTLKEATAATTPLTISPAGDITLNNANGNRSIGVANGTGADLFLRASDGNGTNNGGRITLHAGSSTGGNHSGGPVNITSGDATGVGNHNGGTIIMKAGASVGSGSSNIILETNGGTPALAIDKAQSALFTNTLTVGVLPAEASLTPTVVTSNTGLLQSISAANLAALTSWVLGGNTAPPSNIFGTLDATDVDMRVNNSTIMYLQSANGRVGIGTNTPNPEVGRLDVVVPAGGPSGYGDVRISHANNGSLGATLGISNPTASVGSAAAVAFDVDGTDLYTFGPPNAEIRAVNMLGGVNNATDLAFSIWNGVFEQEAMRIINDGTVKIDNLSADANLNPSVVTNVSGVLESLSATSLASLTSWVLTGNTGLIDGTNNFFGTLDNTPVRFITGSGGPNERMRIDASGNVGIHQTNPTHTLEVNGTVDASETDGIASSNWDLAVYGDMAATGIIKSGASITIDGTNNNNLGHPEISADNALDIYSSGGDLTLGTGEGPPAATNNINLNPDQMVIINPNFGFNNGSGFDSRLRIEGPGNNTYWDFGVDNASVSQLGFIESQFNNFGFYINNDGNPNPGGTFSLNFGDTHTGSPFQALSVTGAGLATFTGQVGQSSGVQIVNTDNVGTSFPLVIYDNPVGQTWGTAAGNTEGRMLRLDDQTNIYDFGISQSHNFYLGNGDGINGQLLSVSPAGIITTTYGTGIIHSIAGVLSSSGISVGDIIPGGNNTFLNTDNSGVVGWNALNVGTSLQGDGSSGGTPLNLNLGHSNTWTVQQIFSNSVTPAAAGIFSNTATTAGLQLGANISSTGAGSGNNVALVVSAANSAGNNIAIDVAAGDLRLMPLGAGQVVYTSTPGKFLRTLPGTATTVLHGTTPPSYSGIVTGDITAGGTNTFLNTDNSGTVGWNALNIDGTTLTGNASSGGTALAINLSNANTWLATETFQQLNPRLDITYSLGSTTNRWQELYLGPSSLHLYALAGEAGGTLRDWSEGVNALGRFTLKEATAGSTPLIITPAGIITTMYGTGVIHSTAGVLSSSGVVTADLTGGANNNFLVWTGGAASWQNISIGGGLQGNGVGTPLDVNVQHDASLTGAGTTASNLVLNLAHSNTWTVTQTFPAASITNAELANSTIGLTNADGSLTVGGSPISLGGSGTVTLNLAHPNTWTVTQTFPAASITNAELANSTIGLTNADGSLTVGGSPISLGGSGTVTLNLAHPNTWTVTQTFPAASITNAELANSTIGLTNADGSLTVGGSPISLGGSGTVTLNLAHPNTWTVTQTFPAASITNAELANSTIGLTNADGSLTVGGSPISLGGSGTVTLNLAHPNSWTATQTFPPSSLTNAELANSTMNFTSVGSTLNAPGPVALGSSVNYSINLNNPNSWTATQTFPPSSLTNAELANSTMNFTSVGSTLNAPGPVALGSSVNYSINLNNPNSWTATQTFPPSSLTNAELANSTMNFTSADNTLNAPGPVALGSSVNYGINLSNANSWIGVQTFPPGSLTNTELANSTMNFTSADNTLNAPGPVALGSSVNYGINLSNANSWIGVQTFPPGSLTNTELANSTMNFTSADNTLNAPGPVALGSSVNYSINLANPNTWSATQTFPAGSITNGELANSTIGLTSTDGSLTVPATLTLGDAADNFQLNLSNPNTWTGIQTFPDASITNGELASSTIGLTSTDGSLTVPATLTLGDAADNFQLNLSNPNTWTGAQTFDNVSANNLKGAGAGKYAEQHIVSAGEAGTIAGNSITINNADITGATSVVVATFVSAGGGGTATFIKSILTGVGTATITLDAPPVQGDIYNIIIVNP